jgi:hypothetical protein
MKPPIIPNPFTGDLIQKVRDRQEQFPELRKSHHFVCDSNFVPSEPTEYLLLGASPGRDDLDWAKTDGSRDEETRDRDFQAIYGRSKGSQQRLDKIQAFFGGLTFRQMSQSQSFFWCSSNTGKGFEERYGYKFKGNPHELFCAQINMALIARLKPKAVFVEGHQNIDALKRAGKCEFRYQLESQTGNVFFKEWRLENETPCFSFTHLSALGNHIKDRPELSKLIREKVTALGT